jgi:thiol:disulfide interchange protein DsbC
MVFGAALVACGLTAGPGALAGDSVAASAKLSRQEIAAMFAGISADDVRDGPMPGLYEVSRGGRVSYVSEDGRLLIQGEVIEMPSKRNLTEARRAEARAALLATVDPAKEIIFTPENGIVRHRVTVFTDVDCGFCRQLHRQIALYNALGIEVRYLSYPRTGPNTESWAKAEHVWCARDRQTTLTQAKLGADVLSLPGCESPPVAEEYNLGRQVGVSATPAVYADNGVQLGGYVPPAELLKQLDELEASAKP